MMVSVVSAGGNYTVNEEKLPELLSQ